jgi:hypothetical protein
MKRLFSFVVFGLGALALGGCPIYPDQSDHRVCSETTCYECPTQYISSDCTPDHCDRNSDCPVGYSCGADRTCVRGGATGCTGPADCPTGQTCGADRACHSSDCSINGCVSPYICKLSGGKFACVPPGADGGTGGPSADASTDSGSVTDGGAGCQTDSDCASLGTGAKCLSGTCVPPKDQCSDGTQCPPGNQCVDGACIPSCDASHPCPTGYGCDTTKGICTGNPTPCEGDAGGCPSGRTCVSDHCVDPCGEAGTCPSGSVCVSGGCVPDGRAQFVCNKDGTSAAEGTEDACAPGSICLHRSCYIGCDLEAGATACKSADKFNVCKSVATSSGSYAVCGSTDNLGSDCDPQQGKACGTGLVCIDGFCR